jgi:hypothetical protein
MREQTLARLLLYLFTRRLRCIVETTPVWVGEEMLSASERGKAARLFDFRAKLQYTMCL